MIPCFDDPSDPTFGRLADAPRIDARPCHSSLWASAGVKPHTHFVHRQRAVPSQAYREATIDWVVLLDADEVTLFPDDTLSNGALSLRVRRAEELGLPGTGTGFRHPIDRHRANGPTRNQTDFLHMRFGIVYPLEGKSLFCIGPELPKVKSPWAPEGQGTVASGPMSPPGVPADLLHFVVPVCDHRRARLNWRRGIHGVSAPSKAHLGKMTAGPDPKPDHRAFYGRLHALTGTKASALVASGGLIRQGPEV